MAAAATTTRTGDAYGEAAGGCRSTELEGADGGARTEEPVLCSSPPATKSGQSIPRSGSERAGGEPGGRPWPAVGEGRGGALLPGVRPSPSMVTAARLGRVTSASVSVLREHTAGPVSEPFRLVARFRPPHHTGLVVRNYWLQSSRSGAVGGRMVTDGHRRPTDGHRRIAAEHRWVHDGYRRTNGGR